MTYYEWVAKYESYSDPEGGWDMTDRSYVLAEIYSDIQEHMRNEYPEYWEQFSGQTHKV